MPTDSARVVSYSTFIDTIIVSVIIFAIFDVQFWWPWSSPVQGHPGSKYTGPVESPLIVSYLPWVQHCAFTSYWRYSMRRSCAWRYEVGLQYMVWLTLLSDLWSYRRVHVTQSVVDWLGGDYDVETGHGANRSEYLYKHNITTYLIKDNQPRMKVSLSL